MFRSASLLAVVSLLYSSASAFDQTSLLQVKQEVAAGSARSAAEAEESLDKDLSYLKDDAEDEQDEEEDTEEDQQTAQQASAAWKSALKAQVMQRLHTQQQPRQQQGKLTYKQAQLQRRAFGQQHAPHGQKFFSQQTVQAAKGKVGHAAGQFPREFPRVISSDDYASPDVSLSLPQQQLISYGMEVQTSVADSAMPMLSAVLGLPDSSFVPPDGSWGPISGLHQPVLANSEMGKQMGKNLGATLGTMLVRQMLGPREADYAPYGYAPSYYTAPAQYYWPHYGYGNEGWVDGVSMPYFPAPLPRVNPYQGYYGYPLYGSMR